MVDCHQGAQDTMAKQTPITRLRDKRKIFERVARKRGKGTPWKLPTKRVVVKNRKQAERIGRAIAYFAGGYEVYKVKGGYSVGSKGYYHYVGA